MARVKKIKRVSYGPDKMVILYEDGTLEERKRNAISEALIALALEAQEKTDALRDIS